MQELAQSPYGPEMPDADKVLASSDRTKVENITINALDPFSPALMYMWSCLLSLYTGDDQKAMMARNTAEDFAKLQFEKFQEIQSSINAEARKDDNLVSQPNEEYPVTLEELEDDKNTNA